MSLGGDRLWAVSRSVIVSLGGDRVSGGWVI